MKCFSLSVTYEKNDMTEKEFSSLLKPDGYQVFLLTCPAHMPFPFARHPWLVVNAKGTVRRFEVLVSEKKDGAKPRHLYVSDSALSRGIGMFSFSSRSFWKSRLEDSIEGGDDSVAARLAGLIERSPAEYPHRNAYALLGPNSNTYAAWVLAQFPELGLALPRGSFGKNWRG